VALGFFRFLWIGLLVLSLLAAAFWDHSEGLLALNVLALLLAIASSERRILMLWSFGAFVLGMIYSAVFLSSNPGH
jgi:hypothetical protein